MADLGACSVVLLLWCGRGASAHPDKWGAVPVPPGFHSLPARREPATPAMVPFSWVLRGLPIWGSLDWHRPILPTAYGWSHPISAQAPDPSGLCSTLQGPLANHLARRWCPPGAGGRNELQRGSGGALAARRDGGRGCHGDAARESGGASRRLGPRGGFVSPSSPRLPRCLYVLTSRGSVRTSWVH